MNRIVKHLLFMTAASLALAVVSLLITDGISDPVFIAGTLIVQILVLTGIPFVIAGIPTLIIFLSKKKMWNNFYTIIWVLWAIIGIASTYGQISGSL